MTKTNVTKTAGVAAVALALLAGFMAYSAMVSPVSAQTATSTSSSTTAQSNTNPTVNCGRGIAAAGQPLPGQFGPRGPMARGWGGGGPWQTQQQANLTIGQTITVTSSAGQYFVVGNTSENGTASGTITFAVTGKLATGYTLSITQGSIVVNGATYSLSSGSAQMDTSASTLTGQGSTTPTGQFIIHASAHGTFVGSSANVSLDLGTGSSEYLVNLTGTVAG